MSAYAYFLDAIQQKDFLNSREKGSVIIGEADPDDRSNWVNDGLVIGMSCALKQGKGAEDQGFNLWPAIGPVLEGVTSITNKREFAKDILKAALTYPGEMPSLSEANETSEGGYVIWAQDIEYHPTWVEKTGGNANEVYAGITALLWAGRQVLGDDFIIAPVPSSSIFKNLGDFDTDVILNGNDESDYLKILQLDNLPSKQSSGKEWNYLSVLFQNDIIDGFLGQQYTENNIDALPGSVSADTRKFLPGEELPYAILSAWSNPSQLRETTTDGPPWNSYYNGGLPFNAGAYFGGAESYPTDLDLSDYLIPTKQSLPSLQIASEQEDVAILNFTGLGNDQIDVNISVKNNISQDFILGYYLIKDDQGSVLDPLTGELLTPGDDGYRSAALNQLNQASELTNLTGNESPSTNWVIEDLKEDELISPYLQVIDNHRLNTFFAFDDANPGGFSHFKNLGVNSYGVDVNFDGKPADYKDLMIALTFPEL